MTVINQTTSFFGLFWWCFIPIYICASVRLHCSEITTETEVIMLDLELIDLEQQVTFSEMQCEKEKRLQQIEFVHGSSQLWKYGNDIQ